MKKTAAGSLFTSCIEQVEPDGILALREAKARYYDALAQLRAKDGIYREAEAALRQAEAAVQQAQADKIKAETDAYTKMQALERELKQLQIDSMTMEMELRAAEIAAEIDSIQKALEIAKKDHEINLIKKQKELAEAQEALRVALRDIALAAQDLTENEKMAVIQAAEFYLMAREAVIDKEHEIFELQTKLDSTKLAANEAWDPESHDYVDAIELYNRQIDQKLAEIADFEKAIENIPNDVPGAEIEKALKDWQDDIDEYKAKQQELDYALAGISKDKAALLVKYHDANAAYRSKLNSYLNANYPFLGDMNSNFGYPMGDPASLTEDDIPVDPEGSTEYTVHFGFEDEEGVLGEAGKEYNQGDVIGYAAEDANLGKVLPDIEIKAKPAFAKFNYLLGSYAGIDVEGTTVDIIKDGAWDKVDADMKAFILGTEEGTVGSQKLVRVNDEGKEYTAATADYGLWGAYSVLKRDKVLYPEEADDLATVKAQRDAAKKLWEEHRAVLEKGLAAYKPYTDALAALTKAQTEESSQGDAMIAAINEMNEALESVNSVDLSKNDSVRIIKAFAAFAKAREEYLQYYEDSDKPTKDITPSAINFKYYRYGSSKKGGETIIDSVLFSALTYEDLAKDKYGYLTTDADTRYCGDAEGFTPEKHQYALAHIARQLLNKDYADMILKDPAVWDFSACDLNATIGTPAHNAFYGEYKYVAKDEDPKNPDAHMKCTFSGKEEDPYESPALKAAKDNVNAAIAQYKLIYENFWGTTWPCNVTYKSKATDVAKEAKKELKVERYLAETFMKPFNVVTFNADGEVEFTNAIGAILGTVDNTTMPANTTSVFGTGKGTKDVTGADLESSGIVNPSMDVVLGTAGQASKEFAKKTFSEAKGLPKFNPARTDFYNYMVAEYRVWLAENPADADMEVIKAWIEEVEEAFDGANEQAAEAAKAAYELDKAAYDEFVAYADFTRDLWTEFAGSYMSSGVLKFRPKITNIKLEESGDYTLRIAYSGLAAQTDAPWSATSTGSSWNANLKAKQLEFANEVMGDLPKEVAAHNAVYTKNRDEYAHAQIMINALTPAYIAAAKVADYNKYQELNADGELVDKTVSGATVEELIAAYETARKEYKKTLEGYIKTADEKIKALRDSIKKIENGKPAKDVEIDLLEGDLEKAKIELNALEEICKGAKENLDRILAYVASLDVNFVIPGFVDTPTSTVVTPEI